MGLLGPQLQVDWQVDAAVPPAVAVVRLRASTAVYPAPFRLVARLSGGGAIVRALGAPATALPFFGEVGPARVRLARVPHVSSISPWAPIARGAFEAAPGGSRLRVSLRPHPQAGFLGELASLFAAPLAVAGLVALASAPGYAVALLVWVGAMVAVPRWWARRSFAAEVAGLQAALTAVLATAVPGEDALAAEADGGSDADADADAAADPGPRCAGGPRRGAVGPAE